MLREQPGVIAVIAVLTSEYIAEGAMDVLEVVLALKVLSLGNSGVGYLAAAFGAGAILGGALTVALVGRQRLVGVLLAAGVVWGAAFLVLGVWPAVGLAFGLLAGAGVSCTVLDVAGRTMLHRTVPPQFHGRVFGVLESVAMPGLAAGSFGVPVLVALGGAKAALIGVGVLLVGVALTTARTLRLLERNGPDLQVQLGLLRGSTLFSMLAAPVLEDLARALLPQAAHDGHAVIRQGETGDRYYLVGEGQFTVTIDGATTRTVGPGDGFGEIALLRDGIRTATVTADGPATVWALDRAPFPAALTGSFHARRAADEVMALHLGPAG
jgi:MFS family permease